MDNLKLAIGPLIVLGRLAWFLTRFAAYLAVMFAMSASEDLQAFFSWTTPKLQRLFDRIDNVV